jgi:cyclohexa-1,5-dienecarbonyl-CoA hydratase
VSDAPLRIAREGAVARLSLACPPLNVLDRSLNRALAEAVRAHGADPEVAAIVLDGGASRGFSAGVEVADHVPGRVEGMLEDFHGAIRALWDVDCPTLAAVHGFALGGGLELAIACDFVVAEETARLGFPEIALGCYPPAAAAMLPARVGWASACELALMGEPLTPRRAHERGLVNRVCRAGTLERATRQFLAPLLEKSPAVLREAKRALREGARDAQAGALARIEQRYLGGLMALDDPHEGIRAFMDKRPPRFRNR